MRKFIKMKIMDKSYALCRIVSIALITTFLFSISIANARQQTYSTERLGHNPKLPTIGIVTTGGTIAEKFNLKTGRV